MGALSNWMILSVPGLLAGFAALAIPLIVHLISRSRGRRVLIGNIALVRSARRRLVHQLRITQWLLLIVRLTLLGVAALIVGRLAAPGLQELNGDAAYVTPAWLAVASPAALAGLEGKYTTVRLLAPGFPDPEAPYAQDEHYDLWPLLAERLSVVHHA
ncbi:MAG: BatA domain-containing protein, partial [Anaerolineae bacterium]